MGVSMLRLSPLPLCLLAAALCGAESQELQTEARTIYPEMLRKDLWSALLWEKWAENQGRRSSGNMLENGISMMGSPTFALPEDVHGLKDRGATVEVVTKRRWYCFAADGHPCKVPIAFGMDTVEAAAYSFDPGYVSAIGYKYNAPSGSIEWHQRCFRTDNGALVFETSDEEDRVTDAHSFDPIMADDGSAVALAWHNLQGSWISVTTAHEANHRYQNVSQPIGVGRGGSWLVASRYDDNKPVKVLVVGDQTTTLRAVACGPGVAVIMLPDNHTELVGLDGKRTPISLPIGVGENPQLETVGDYLVVGSGQNAVSLDNTDFFGVPLRDPPRQPDLVAVVRWKDVLAGRPRVCASYPGLLTIDLHHSAAFHTWKERQAQWVDCAGPAPQARPFYQAAERIHWVGPLRLLTLVNFGDKQNALVDEGGHELWQGEGNVTVFSSDLALVTEGDSDPSYTLIHLSADPKARTSVRLKPGSGWWDFVADPFRRIVVADKDGTWIKYSYAGEQIAEGGHGKFWPDLLLPVVMPGRYCYAGGRLIDKFNGIADAKVEDHLLPMDAYLVPCSRSGVALVVLERFGEVARFMRARRAWEWQDAGPCEFGYQFAMTQRERSLVISATDRAHILAEVMDANVNLNESRDRTDDLPPGPWRVMDLSFVPRNSNTLTWSDDAIGFHPLRLRSPERIASPDPLLVITASMVLSVTQESRLMQVLAVAGSPNAR